MKTRIFVLFWAATALVLSACQKNEIRTEENRTERPKETCIITAEMPRLFGEEDGTATKIDFTQGDGRITMSWKENDAIRIVNELGESEVFTLTEFVDETTAKFEGNVLAGNSFTVLYPGTVASEADMDAFTYSGQVQNGNGSTEHLSTSFCVKITGLSDYSSITFDAASQPAGATLSRSGVLKLRLQLPGNIQSVSSVTVTADEGNVFLADNAGASKSSSVTLSLQNADITADSILVAYMATPWTQATLASGHPVKVSVEVPDGEGVLTFSKYKQLTSSVNILPGRSNLIQFNKANWYAEGLFAEGSGTAADPYLIRTVQDMLHVGKALVSGQTRYFKVADDVTAIDMSSVTSWTPYNLTDKAIDFNGNNKTISNFDVSGSLEYQSIFGNLIGKVYNVRFVDGVMNSTAIRTGFVCGSAESGSEISGITGNVTITAEGLGVGALAGVAKAATMKDCSMTVDIQSATRNVGGLVGYTPTEGTVPSTMSNCSSSGSVTGDFNVGGLVGYVCSVMTINDNSSSSCTVVSTTTSESNSRTGGLVGYAQQLTLENCHASGDVSASKQGVGGLVGSFYDYSVMRGCYATGNVTGPSNTGGLVGGMTKAARMEDCYYQGGTVTTTTGDNIGGLVGIMTAGTIRDCHASGTLVAASDNMGGIVGSASSGSGNLDIFNCYTTMDLSNTAANYMGGIVGNLTVSNDDNTVKIHRCHATGGISAKNRAGGLVGNVSRADELTNVCRIDSCYYKPAAGKKIETANHYAGGLIGYGAGVEIDSCQVSGVTVTTNGNRCGGLIGQAKNAAVRRCKVTGVTVNAALAGTGTTVTTGNGGGLIGNCEAGNGVVVEDCLADATVTARYGAGGLIGYGVGVTVKRCRAVGGDVIAKAGYAGGLIGSGVPATVSMCAVTKDLVRCESGNYAGGLVGSLSTSASVTDSYAQVATVRATQYVGGLVGCLNSASSILRCYVTGSVVCTRGGGGVVGMMHAQKTNSVSSSISWVSSVSGATTSATWSAGTVVGTTHPLGFLTGNYRKDGITLTTYTETNTSSALYALNGVFDQDDVDEDHPLQDNTGTGFTDTSAASGQAHYPKYPYHGKVASRAWTDAGLTAPADITLSALAGQIGWGSATWTDGEGGVSAVWNLSGATPVLNGLP